MTYRHYLSIAVAICFSSQLAHADWPQWLGPDRTGGSSETGLSTTWATDGPPVVWERELGEGFSGISVADGRVYTMFSDRESEFAICLDEATGAELWRVKTGGKFHERQGGNGPRSQPTVDGDQVFVLGATGVLYALNASDGKKLWQVDLRDELGSRIPRFRIFDVSAGRKRPPALGNRRAAAPFSHWTRRLDGQMGVSRRHRLLLLAHRHDDCGHPAKWSLSPAKPPLGSRRPMARSTGDSLGQRSTT